MSRVLVFAYGSNMDPERMRARVPGALPRGRARLPGHRLVIDKRGRDGSAKANLRREAGALVWGVTWDLRVADLAALDGHEAGYERILVSVELESGTADAHAYRSDRLAPGALPFDWYLEHVLRGARAFGLPEDYVAWLESLPRAPGR
jgi:hypothetical protein